MKGEIVSRFYLITLAGDNIYVGYTNRPIKERFREHVKDKELPKEALIKQIDKLEFEFTWDMVQVNENAKRVSKRENELIDEYGTSSSKYQKGLGNIQGGQTWASVKAFVHSNKDNPQYAGMDSQELLAYLDNYRKRMGKLSNFISNYKDPRLTKLSNFISRYKDPRLSKLSAFIGSYKDPRLTKLSHFVSGYKDPRLTKLSAFIGSYKDPRLTKLSNFITHYQDPRLYKLSHFISHYQDPRLDKLHYFISNYKDPRLDKLHSFIGSYKDPRLDKLRDFIGNYKDPRLDKLHSFISHYKN